MKLIDQSDFYQPRPYQQPIIDAVKKGFKRIIAIMPRRAGKDITAWNICISECLKRPQTIFYCLPTFQQCRKVIWTSITNDGKSFLDFVPKEYVYKKNEQQMSITFINGSVLQLIGSDSYNTSLIGTNPQGIVFSEFALSDVNAYLLARPILAANGGFLIVLSTPRGKNALWDLYQMAKDYPETWFTYKLTLDDTKHISDEVLAQERLEMSEDLIQQEYFCSFELGVEGAIYAKYIDQMRLNGQIGVVPWDASQQVNTSWDIGRDCTSIIFYQHSKEGNVRIIDYYEKTGENLEFFIKHVLSKEYIYNKHFFPHDMRVTEWAGPKFTRVEKARQLGLKATIVPDVGKEDGIEHVRSKLRLIYIDQSRCGQLIKALENYRREYDSEKRVYKENPLHNWASHPADAMRYLCVSLDISRVSHSKELYDKLWEESRGTNRMPRVFDENIPNY